MLITLIALVLAVPPAAAPAPAAATPEAVRFEELRYHDVVEADGSWSRSMDVRVRCGTVQGVAALGQVAQDYIVDLGEVRFESVVIVKPDGRRVEVKNAPEEDINPFGISGTAYPADVRYRKITIPGLEPGDTLSYRVLHREKPLASGRVFGQVKLPVLPGDLVQVYELDLPRSSAIKVHLREGLSWEQLPSAADRVVRRLSLAVRAPTGEPKLSKKERENWSAPDVVFSNFGSWSEVASWWWDLSRDRLKPDAAILALGAELTRNATTAQAKASALLAFVANNIRYLNVSFGLGRMQPRTAASVLQNRFGDCKDKHALLAALAAGVGLDVRPVLVNSVRAELGDDAPGPQQFDHMISVLRLGTKPSEWLWMDATNPFASQGHLFPALRGKRALLVDPDGSGSFVQIPEEPPFVPRHEVSIEGTLDTANVLRAHATWVFRSDSEVQLRAVLADLSQERRVRLVKALADEWDEAKVENVVVSDPQDVSIPLRVECDLEKALPAEAGERTLWIPLPTFSLPEAESPVSAGDSPATFPVREFVLRAQIELPEGYQARAPLSVTLDRAFGAFRSTYSVDGRKLLLGRTMTLSGRSLPEADVAAYEAFRSAVGKDRKQEFVLEAGPAGPATAEAWRAQGIAAFDKEDYALAAELLAKSADSDPKGEDVWEYLGRTRLELGQREEAVAAFTRQIEVAPFHESAYAWRAHALVPLGRGEEAERDFLKQIEVAPFKPKSYARMGARRLAMKRFTEAADYYARAAALEPKKPGHWLELGVAQAGASLPEEARRSLDRAMTLDPLPEMKLRAALTYRRLGDVARAGALGAAALPSLGERLLELEPDELDSENVEATDDLIEAWHLVGEAASEAGDLPRAARYLDAAWRVGFSARTGWLLGEVREKQGRLADAVDLWSMASNATLGGRGLPADREARIATIRRKLTGPQAAGTASRAPGLPDGDTSGGRLTALRSTQVSGSATGSFSADVLVLAGADGVVERIVGATGKESKTVERQISRLGHARIALTPPDATPFKLVRRALLACSAVSGCSLILDLPGLTGATTQNASTLRIVTLDPPAGTALVRGQQVAIAATVHYELGGSYGTMTLIAGNPSARPEPTQLATEFLSSPTGEVTLRGVATVPADASQFGVLVLLVSPESGGGASLAQEKYTLKSAHE